MGFKKVGAWKEAQKLLAQAAVRARKAGDAAMLAEAHFFRTKIVEGINAGAPAGKTFAPLSAFTLAGRRLKKFRGTKVLIHTGQLRNSVQVDRNEAAIESGYFVGVSYQRRARNGLALQNIAAIHEYGAGPFVIKVTPKMRRFLGVLTGIMNKKLEKGRGGRLVFRDSLGQFVKAPRSRNPGGGGKDIIVIKIPPRPFIGPVWAKWGSPSAIKFRVTMRMSKLLKGYLAR